jgi:hypothetical protein
MTGHHNSPLSCELGWAEAGVLTAVHSDPSLAWHLLTVPKQRLHFVAFVLAVTEPSTPPALLRDAIRLPIRDVLPQLGLTEMRGLRRVLGRIRGPVIERDWYRRIASLLREPNTAQVLFHMPEITPELLANLAALPIPMRTHVIAQATGHLPDAASHIVQWTEIVSTRISKLSAQDIQENLGDSHSLVDLKHRLTKLLDALPALEGPPPKVIHHALRVDPPSAIRQLGKHFMNCLDSFVSAEIDGCKHIYHWRRGNDEAVCEVSRVGNLGWFLDSCLGAQNADLEGEVSAAIASEFRSVGIYSLKIVETYDDFLHAIGRRDRGGVNGNGEYAARDRRRHLR